MTEPLLTVDDLRARWQLPSRRFVYRIVEDRRIAFLRIGRELRFNLADVEAYENANRSEPQPSIGNVLTMARDEVPANLARVRSDNRRRSGSRSCNGGGARQATRKVRASSHG
jgi:excisionase family DNA binding protein